MYVSDDLVSEILSHLPVQSLLRFKTECKSWNTIISSPIFVESHLNNYGKNNNFILLTASVKLRLSLASFGISSPSSSRLTVVDRYSLELPIVKIIHKIIGPLNGSICIYGTA
ncbi:hypothetical protein MIMGU_mgv1a024385mg, partial [Erythranthe guttata]